MFDSKSKFISTLILINSFGIIKLNNELSNFDQILTCTCLSPDYYFDNTLNECVKCKINNCL